MTDKATTRDAFALKLLSALPLNILLFQRLSQVSEGASYSTARQAGWELSGPSEYSHMQQLKDRPTVVPSATNLINIYNLLNNLFLYPLNYLLGKVSKKIW